MSRYMIVCRLRWPAMLLLTGVIALLDQANILSWGRAWPLYLILWGILALAERALLASEPPMAAYPYGTGYPTAGYPQGYPQPAAPYAGQATPAPATSVQGTTAVASTGIVPTNSTLGLQTHDEEGR